MQSKPSIEEVWNWISEVPDPEIPAISLVDLGIIRNVVWDADMLSVTITPTYSGCPATAVIKADITAALKKNGIDSVQILRQLSPAWTTDWLSQSGREKLFAYGISPPVVGTAATGIGKRKSPRVICPQCRSEKTEVVSQFGSTPCKASYRCIDCLEPFDYFKCI